LWILKNDRTEETGGVMKLMVEIVDNKFKYSYEVGESKHSGSNHICADTLVLFTDLLRACSQSYKYADKQWERDAIAKAWAEKQNKSND